MGEDFFSKSGPRSREKYDGKHRREHWYCDRMVYFLTASVREKLPLFLDPECQSIFWTKFDQYAGAWGFEPWVVTLMSTHYHAVGYFEVGRNLGEMMCRLHGSVARLVFVHHQITHVPFWGESQGDNYMDGCLRSLKQLVKSYEYTRDQAVRAKLVRHYSEYPNTRVIVDLDEACRRAVERDALMEGVPYPRYERGRGTGS